MTQAARSVQPGETIGYADAPGGHVAPDFVAMETRGHADAQGGHGRSAVRARRSVMMDVDEDVRPRDAAFVRRGLFESRTVLIFGEVSDALAERVSAELLALDARSDAPIRVIVHSPGGHVEAGDTIHDVIRFVRAPIVVIGTGWVASAGALIYAAAEKERRFALPNTRFLLHQPLGGLRGRASEIEIEAAQILAMRARLDRIFAAATGRSVEQIVADTERNHWMSAREACEYGLVHRVIERPDEL